MICKGIFLKERLKSGSRSYYQERALSRERIFKTGTCSKSSRINLKGL